MENRKAKLGAPITTSVCVALVESALQQASSERKDGSAGLSLDLSSRKIGSIPSEVVAIVKDDVERLALGHNQLSSFDPEFGLCSRLRYLNVRSNFFRDFPVILCKMASLEILDISRNRIKELPADFGHLIRLKVLCFSKNKLRTLPNYICQMNELKILRIDRNPLINLPQELYELEDDGYADKEGWLEKLKAHLRQNMERQSASNETEDSNSSDGDNDTDYSNIGKLATLTNKQVGREPTSTWAEESSRLRIETSAPDDLDSAPAIPFKNLQRKFAGGAPQPSGSSTAPALPISGQITERSRSNSESGPANRATKRMGYIGQKNILGTVDEVRTIKHHVRGISYDSSMNEAAQRASNVPNNGDAASSFSGATPRNDTRSAGPYFRRIQGTLKQYGGVDAAISSTILETARSILYSMYKVLPAIDSYVGLLKERNRLQTTGIDRVLPAANLNISSLIQSLELCEARDGQLSLDGLLNTSHTTILSFKHVLNQLQQVIHGAANHIESRYTRTILLAIFGSLVELQQAWTVLRKYIMPPNNTRSGNVIMANRIKLPFPSPLGVSNIVTNQRTVQEAGFLPPTPGTVLENPLENPDEILFDRLGTTVAATMQLIVVLSDAIKKTASQQNVQQSTLQKLRELDKICNNGSDVAKRLKARLDLIRDADWVERRRFFEDITRFVTSVMSIGELLKAGSSEFGFPKQALGGFSPVARLTKEVTVLLHNSSFRSLNDPSHPVPTSSTMTTPPASFPNNVPVHFQPLSPAPFSAVPSTPLSAVLGPAAQATVPFLAPGVQFIPGEHQRSNTMQSASRTMTGISEMGFSAGVVSPRR
ncbi:RAM signaling network component [Orbilia oligospora]|uniref:RAM signaling network component n=1 Tax=Orbilia oligospora TaxID=2813651 RepID=A0A7C8K3Z2_ORBOL|nr:RAM signaling network component [Orbilia oligospora]KAF3172571.1 RAM signaling network component [Orbilia oligospora]KAF3237012.1 RAM signaling network component [Orbilia oligospora]KAF3251616.1 RAM signaling network component [Orbilia oligospora]KAF3277620.1 RAM signaling network component [Orbilia oligospora]